MELPTITASSYVSSTADPRLMLGHAGLHQPARLGQDVDVLRLMEKAAKEHDAAKQAIFNQPKKEITPMSTARIVKVFIADPNENLPLDKRVLYSGDEKLTDLTDQELFFDVPMAELLAKHNALRAVTIDKKQEVKSGREVFLEPARIRDLKMVVVTVAQF